MLGEIQVSDLLICAPEISCGGDIWNIGVGVDINLDYVRHDGDPVDSFALRWIQVVKSIETPKPGVPRNGLDLGSNTDTPFYFDRPSLGSKVNFYDRPYRTYPHEPHLWTAELYLAEVKRQPGKQVATIYNGFTWGWLNIIQYREPTACKELKDASGSGGGDVDKEGCRDFDKGQTQDEPLQEDVSFEERKLFFDVPSNLW